MQKLLKRKNHKRRNKGEDEMKKNIKKHLKALDEIEKALPPQLFSKENKPSTWAQVDGIYNDIQWNLNFLKETTAMLIASIQSSDFALPRTTVVLYECGDKIEEIEKAMQKLSAVHPAPKKKAA